MKLSEILNEDEIRDVHKAANEALFMIPEKGSPDLIDIPRKGFKKVVNVMKKVHNIKSRK